MSKSILTPAEHQQVCNPQDNHENEVIHRVLKDILVSINGDPSKMMVFIEYVLEKIGGPADGLLATKMSKLHKF